MSTTINKEEIQKFSRLADEWWDVNGKATTATYSNRYKLIDHCLCKLKEKPYVIQK